MENPLSKEQLEELAKISRLPKEEQQAKLQEFLATLTPEQVKFLKENYGAREQCPFCLMVEGKIEVKKVYEDDDVLAILDINPANKGHTIVFPKKHHNILTELSDKETAHIFTVTNWLLQSIHNVLKAEGSNVFVANGAVAGQKSPHVLIHIIPRFEQDNIDFSWTPKRVSSEEMDEIANKIKASVKKEEIVKIDTDEEIYKQEERIP